MMKTDPVPSLKWSVRLWGAVLVGLAALVIVLGMSDRCLVFVPYQTPVAGMPPREVEVQLRTFRAAGGWGYTIYLGNQRLIHQPFIPALPGNRGFATEQKARRAGQWVVRKICRGQGPPSVSLRELDSLGVLD